MTISIRKQLSMFISSMCLSVYGAMIHIHHLRMLQLFPAIYTTPEPTQRASTPLALPISSTTP